MLWLISRKISPFVCPSITFRNSAQAAHNRPFEEHLLQQEEGRVSNKKRYTRPIFIRQYKGRKKPAAKRSIRTNRKEGLQNLGRQV